MFLGGHSIEEELSFNQLPLPLETTLLKNEEIR